METMGKRLWPVLVAWLAVFGWPTSGRWQAAGSSPFTLEGSQNSYAQMRKWNAGLNGTLQLEFRTAQPNGLLVYTDDGGKFDFFELKLVEGALRLRYNLGAGAQILTVGRNLSDGHWHNVTVKRSGEQTALTVDHVTVTRASRGKEFSFGNLATNSPVYIGGLPAWYSAELTRLALPSVLFEPRYRGDLRNVIFSDAGGQPVRQQEILESQVKSSFSCNVIAIGYYRLRRRLPSREYKTSDLISPHNSRPRRRLLFLGDLPSARPWDLNMNQTID